eukprot:TRINITY_DN1052_c1_g1_i2.p1 TRINITY_DN1052_c1_g1~~TRINITY_DN1052_c1_g1_i2.p1  ORF type:complete len:484 (-),score=103.32 TRINITY_DN1052_c1_g1_i2:168-1619(-)
MWFATGLDAILKAVVSAVLKIMLLVGVGAKLELQGMLDGPKRKCLSAVAMDVCLPCLMFSRVLPEADAELLRQGWQLLLWPFVYPVVGALLGTLCCLAVGAPQHLLWSSAACAAFPNANGFPVAIVSALGPALPASPEGFTPLVFLSLLQLTDGMVKYTLGPAAFRHELRLLQKRHSKASSSDEELPLGVSVRSIQLEAAGSDGDDAAESPCADEVPSRQLRLLPRTRTATEPEFSRFEAYDVFVPPARRKSMYASISSLDGLEQGASEDMMSWEHAIGLVGSARDLFRQFFPPQVVAVLLALAIGVGSNRLKALFLSPDPERVQAPLGFVYGAAHQLGGGFVPMQLIALGGRLVNVVSAEGPLHPKGLAGPRGRARLLRVAGAVAVARMVLTPAALYGIAVAVDGGRRFLPVAFWAPALIVGAMPTANNMSTMADLVGAGRSVSAATTAMQLLASPAVLAVSLTLLVAGVQYSLASDAVYLS